MAEELVSTSEVDPSGFLSLSPGVGVLAVRGDASVIPAPTITLYDQQRDGTFTVPDLTNRGTVGERETQHLLEREVDKAPQAGVVGTFDTLRSQAQIRKDAREAALPLGFASFIGNLPNVGRLLAIETAEREIEASKKQFGFSDIFVAVSPFHGTGEQRAAGSRVFNQVFNEGKAPDTTLQKRIVSQMKGSIKENREYLKSIGLTRPDGASGVLFDIGSAGGSIGLAIGLTMVTKNPAHAALVFGTIQKSSIYEEAREAGFSPEVSGQLSGLAGALEAAIEAVGTGTFMRLAAVDKPLKRTILRAFEESAQEGAQALAEEMVTQTSGVREFDISAGLGRVAYSAAIGFIAGGGVASVTSLAESQAAEVGVSREEAQTIVGTLSGIQKELQSEGAGGILDALESNISYNEAPRKQAATPILRRATS